MALIQCGFYSDSLQKNTTVHLVLPSPAPDDLLFGRDTKTLYADGRRWQSLYLLHGSYSGGSDWLRHTNVERYAQKYQLALVMPSAENSRYVDMYRGESYLSYISKELPAFLRTIFPLSDRREDTFIAGLSMGGYGAFLAALTAPETFSRAASLSGSLDIRGFLRGQQPHISKMPRSYLRALFEDPMNVPDEYDLPSLLAGHAAAGSLMPDLYLSCGTEDFNLPANDSFYQEASALGASLRYDKHPGGHDWDYWDTHIKDVLAWLQGER